MELQSAIKFLSKPKGIPPINAPFRCHGYPLTQHITGIFPSCQFPRVITGAKSWLIPLIRLVCLGTLGLSGITAIPIVFHQTRGMEVATASSSDNTWRYASFPVENFQGYTSLYGPRPSATGDSGQEFHYGLDFGAPEGSYIRNWWAGKVVHLSDDTNCGTSIIIQSGSWEHVYCHMQGQVELINGQHYLVDRSGGIQIMEGQQIPTAARIGRVGMTGRTTGPHLHWGLKFTGQWIDPALVLRAMYVAQAGGNAPTTP